VACQKADQFDVRRSDRSTANDEAFTLLELAVVILIIGLLMLMAIPSFMRVQRGAHNRAAQSSLRAVLAASAVHYEDDTGYDGILPLLTADNLELQVLVAGASTGPRVVRTDITTDTFRAASLSRTGICYELETNNITLRFGRFIASSSTPCEPGHATIWSTDEW
jgi:type IV pilus assembly protein PilA